MTLALAESEPGSCEITSHMPGCLLTSAGCFPGEDNRLRLVFLFPENAMQAITSLSHLLSPSCPLWKISPRNGAIIFFARNFSLQPPDPVCL